MNTQRTLTAFAAIAAATLLMIGSPAYGQRDAGAKIRGDYSFGSAAPQPRTYSRGFVETQRSFSYEPAEPSAIRRSYSYVADLFAVGDKVVVSSNEAKLMSGTDTRGMLDKGMTFEVRQVEGPWLGTKIEIDGKKISGWVWYGSVTLAHEPSSDSAARAQGARRSFSFEPAEPTYESGRRYTPRRKPLWEYQKTDPRRYRP